MNRKDFIKSLFGGIAAIFTGNALAKEIENVLPDEGKKITNVGLTQVRYEYTREFCEGEVKVYDISIPVKWEYPKAIWTKRNVKFGSAIIQKKGNQNKSVKTISRHIHNSKR